MLKRIQILNNGTKEVLVMDAQSDEAWAVQNGFSADLYDVVCAYDGRYYIDGYAPTKPAPTTDELAASLRTERGQRITACDWIVTRHRDELDKGINTTLGAESYEAWLDYRAALRDLPSLGGFPWDGGGEDTPWPKEPGHNS